MPQSPELYPQDQLVVDLSGLKHLEDELHELGVGCVIERDEQLGLALLTELVDAGGAPLADLDDLLITLRTRSGGGSPDEMGKNREASLIGSSVVNLGSKIMGLVGSVHGRSVHDMNPKIINRYEPQPLSCPELPTPPGPGTGQGVHIGILDWPLCRHERFEGRLVSAEKQFRASATSVTPRAGHATMVTSLILAQAPEARIDVVGLLDSTTGRATSWDIAKQIIRLADSGIQILNLSLGMYTADNEAPLVISRAIDLISQRVLVVAAAGNHGNQLGWQKGRTSLSSTWPAALPDVIAVGAVDKDGKRAEFSPDLPWVDCEAPGVDVEGAYLSAWVELSTGPEQFKGCAKWSGTSFATATVSGLIAAHMTPGKTAREALDELLDDKKTGAALLRC